MSFLSNYAITLQQAVYAMIESLTPDELKNTPKAALLQSVEYISQLLSAVLPAEEAGQISETFQLRLSLQCLACSAVQKRHQGLGSITRLVAMAQRRDITGATGARATALSSPVVVAAGSSGSSGTGATAPAAPPKTTQWLTSAYLLDWLAHHKIVENLFGDSMHSELVKRSNDIFKFLAKKDRFTLEHIDLLWNATRVRLLSFSLSLSVTLVRVITQRIESI